MGTFLELSLEPGELFLLARVCQFLAREGKGSKRVSYLDLVIVQSAVDERFGGAVDFTVWDVENVGDTLSKTEDEGAAFGGGLHDLEVVDSCQLNAKEEVESIRVIADVEEDLWDLRILEDGLKGNVWDLDANGGECGSAEGVNINEVNFPRLLPLLVSLLLLSHLLTRIIHLRPLRSKLIHTLESTLWPDTTPSLFWPSVFLSTCILIDWISGWELALDADLEDGNATVTRKLCAFQVEEEGWKGLPARRDGGEGWWVGGQVEDVDEVRDLKWGGEEGTVDFGAAWSQELALREGLWDVEWPCCEVLVEQSEKGEMGGE